MLKHLENKQIEYDIDINIHPPDKKKPCTVEKSDREKQNQRHRNVCGGKNCFKLTDT